MTHPFGVDTFVATADARSINFTEDIGCMAGPCDFSAAFTSRIGPFLRWDPAQAPPAGFIAPACVSLPVLAGSLTEVMGTYAP